MQPTCGSCSCYSRLLLRPWMGMLPTRCRAVLRLRGNVRRRGRRRVAPGEVGSASGAPSGPRAQPAGRGGPSGSRGGRVSAGCGTSRLQGEFNDRACICNGSRGCVGSSPGHAGLLPTRTVGVCVCVCGLAGCGWARASSACIANVILSYSPRDPPGGQDCSTTVGRE